jgi:hypothetical protein
MRMIFADLTARVTTTCVGAASSLALLRGFTRDPSGHSKLHVRVDVLRIDRETALEVCIHRYRHGDSPRDGEANPRPGHIGQGVT